MVASDLGKLYDAGFGDGLLRNPTPEVIDGFRTRLEMLKLQEPVSRGKRPEYIDSPAIGLYHCLYMAFVKGHYTTLHAALSGLETLYEYANVGDVIESAFKNER